MNLQTLLESLRAERDSLDSVIGVIESRMTIKSKQKKSKEIINGLTRARRKKKQVHWSKQPDVDQVKLAKWKKHMAKQAKIARKAKGTK